AALPPGPGHSSTSQTTTCPRSVPAAASEPSGLNATDSSLPSFQSNDRSWRNAAGSQNQTVPSLRLVAMTLPPGWTASPVADDRRPPAVPADRGGVEPERGVRPVGPPDPDRGIVGRIQADDPAGAVPRLPDEESPAVGGQGEGGVAPAEDGLGPEFPGVHVQ